ncbi:MAG: DoxX family protein [Polyangiaceae bacterium]
MKTWVSKIARLFDTLKSFEWAPILFMRLSVGYMFASSGWRKVHTLGELTDYFRSLHIPAPELQAPFIASLELVGGICLIIGLAVRVFGPLLASTMIVALLTVLLKDPKNHILGNLFYLPEWLLLVTLVWIAFSGAGKISVDALLRKKLAPAG